MWPPLTPLADAAELCLTKKIRQQVSEGMLPNSRESPVTKDPTSLAQPMLLTLTIIQVARSLPQNSCNAEEKALLAMLVS